MRGKYILLNDTAALAANQHLGCNTVTELIHDELQSMGLEHLTSVNSLSEAEKTISSLTGVSLVIMNGEGSVHHDSKRIIGLMAIAKLAKEAGVCTALINTTWQDNSNVLAKYLRYFDIVTVREEKSLSSAKLWCQNAQVVPDLSIKAFSNPLKSQKDSQVAHESVFSLSVIDSMIPASALALRDFALEHGAPMYCMGKKHMRLMTTHDKKIRTSNGNCPKLLERTSQLTTAKACLSGRFHGTIAALCLGQPVIAIPSNTHKICSMLDDIGIKDVSLMDQQWLSDDYRSKKIKLEKRLELWTDSHSKKVSCYITDGRIKINRLFHDIDTLIATREYTDTN